MFGCGIASHSVVQSLECHPLNLWFALPCTSQLAGQKVECDCTGVPFKIVFGYPEIVSLFWGSHCVSNGPSNGQEISSSSSSDRGGNRNCFQSPSCSGIFTARQNPLGIEMVSTTCTLCMRAIGFFRGTMAYLAVNSKCVNFNFFPCSTNRFRQRDLDHAFAFVYQLRPFGNT